MEPLSPSFPTALQKPVGDILYRLSSFSKVGFIFSKMLDMSNDVRCAALLNNYLSVSAAALSSFATGAFKGSLK